MMIVFIPFTMKDTPPWVGWRSGNKSCKFNEETVDWYTPIIFEILVQETFSRQNLHLQCQHVQPSITHSYSQGKLLCNRMEWPPPGHKHANEINKLWSAPTCRSVRTNSLSFFPVHYFLSNLQIVRNTSPPAYKHLFCEAVLDLEIWSDTSQILLPIQFPTPRKVALFFDAHPCSLNRYSPKPWYVVRYNLLEPSVPVHDPHDWTCDLPMESSK